MSIVAYVLICPSLLGVKRERAFINDPKNRKDLLASVSNSSATYSLYTSAAKELLLNTIKNNRTVCAFSVHDDG